MVKKTFKIICNSIFGQLLLRVEAGKVAFHEKKKILVSLCSGNSYKLVGKAEDQIQRKGRDSQKEKEDPKRTRRQATAVVSSCINIKILLRSGKMP